MLEMSKTAYTILNDVLALTNKARSKSIPYDLLVNGYGYDFVRNGKKVKYWNYNTLTYIYLPHQHYEEDFYEARYWLLSQGYIGMCTEDKKQKYNDPEKMYITEAGMWAWDEYRKKNNI